jgi:hypothetical protein
VQKEIFKNGVVSAFAGEHSNIDQLILCAAIYPPSPPGVHNHCGIANLIIAIT